MSRPTSRCNFHYFALRKMHFLLRARAVAVFPGGFGTFDEILRTADPDPDRQDEADSDPAVRQGLLEPRRSNFEAIAEEGTISKKDLDLYHLVRNRRRGWAAIREFYCLKDNGAAGMDCED